MKNIPKVKIGIVAVSRDCFPESLSVNRRKALVKAYSDKYDTDDIYECPICIVESEIHMKAALEDIKKAGCNALCVYLMDLRCLWLPLRKISAHYQMTVAMRTAVCLTQVIT